MMTHEAYKRAYMMSAKEALDVYADGNDGLGAAFYGPF